MLHSAVRLICIRQAFKVSSSTIQTVRQLTVGLVGAPFSGGQRTDGTELAPRYFRNSGLRKEIERLGHQVTDYGDLSFQFDKGKPSPDWGDLKMNYCKDVFDACLKLSKQVQHVLNNQDICVNLGGDHCLGMGSVHGTAQIYPNLSLLWIDAHSDINTFNSTESRNAHGMPVSFLIQELYQKYNRPQIDARLSTQFQPCLPANRLAYVGLRDLEGHEIRLLDEFQICHFSMREIDELGIRRVIELALKAINPNGDRPLHVSLDVDSLDGQLVPNTVLPSPGGLTAREAFTIAEQISATGLLRTLDVVEINPLIGRRADLLRTFEMVNNLILSFLGKRRLQLYARFAGN